MARFDKPIEVAKDIYWVGHVLEGDPFQCHVYLIKNKNESILIDPGSNLTWQSTRKKIMQIMDLDDIKYFICHHQDPDITACMSTIFDEIGTKERYVITHWRTKALLVHYNWNVEFIEVESKDFKLNIKGRQLEFILTPYMHFPGNICTYDTATKTLFSSDIFGGFTQEFKLFADNAQDYFEQMKPFHEHYMPSTEIVREGLRRINEYDIEMIAPQHGSIIKKEFIPYIMHKLRNLDMGLFLRFGGYKNISRLSTANKFLSDLIKISLYELDIYKKMDFVYDRLREILPVKKLVALGFKDDIILFDSALSKPLELDIKHKDIIEEYKHIIYSDRCRMSIIDNIGGYSLCEECEAFICPLKGIHNQVIGLLFFIMEDDAVIDNISIEIMKNLKVPFEAMTNKAIDMYKMEKEKISLFEKTIRDELTSLYNRHYFNIMADKEYIKAARYGYPLSVAFLDLDNFKDINDAYGHNVGDIVLKDFSNNIIRQIRQTDLAFRYGGEEFVVIFPYLTKNEAYEVLKRIQSKITTSKGVNITDKTIEYAFSAGIVQLEDEKDIFELVKKADAAMYKAKQNGKNRIEY